MIDLQRYRCPAGAVRAGQFLRQVIVAINYDTIKTNLETRLAAAVTELAAITTTPPDYGIDGQSITHSARIKLLEESIEVLQRAINRIAPYSVRSRARAG